MFFKCVDDRVDDEEKELEPVEKFDRVVVVLCCSAGAVGRAAGGLGQLLSGTSVDTWAPWGGCVPWDDVEDVPM